MGGKKQRRLRHLLRTAHACNLLKAFSAPWHKTRNDVKADKRIKEIGYNA